DPARSFDQLACPNPSPMKSLGLICAKNPKPFAVIA
ncbi:MAG: hypothetical protein ACI875_002688, partial [Planctomycetota bacterium]